MARGDDRVQHTDVAVGVLDDVPRMEVTHHAVDPWQVVVVGLGVRDRAVVVDHERLRLGVGQLVGHLDEGLLDHGIEFAAGGFLKPLEGVGCGWEEGAMGCKAVEVAVPGSVVDGVVGTTEQLDHRLPGVANEHGVFRAVRVSVVLVEFVGYPAVVSVGPCA